MKSRRTGLKIFGALVTLGLVLGSIQVASAAIIPTTAPVAATEASHLVAWYPMTYNDGGTVNDDAPGAAYNGRMYGNLNYTAGPSTGTCFDGTSNYISLPMGLLGQTSVTVSVDVLDQGVIQNPWSSDPSTYILWMFGVQPQTAYEQPGWPNGYLYVASQPTLHAGITTGNSTPEQVTASNAPLPLNTWTRVTYTYDSQNGNSTADLYSNGTLVAQNLHQTITPSDAGPWGENSTIGGTLQNSDTYFHGCMKDFRIYNEALDPTKVQQLANADSDAANLTVQDINDVRGDLYLPTTLADGASVSWASSNPAVVDDTGIVNRQSTNTPVTLTATVSLGDGWAQQQFTANVIAAPTTVINPKTLGGYAFTYFTGDTKAGENLYVAVSNGDDILNYTAINGGKPILVSHFGTGGLRDPSLIRSPDGDTFYLIATDLSIGSGTTWAQSVQSGSQYIEVWKSHNLVDWTQQAHTLVSLPTAGNTWAPDAIWDPTLNEYVVYWASENYTANSPTPNYNDMMYSTTRDFVNFTSPVTWQAAGGSRLDGAVTYVDATGTYYRFTKDEGHTIPATGCSDILEESSTNLLTLTTSNSEGWTPVQTCIAKKLGLVNVEGPIIVQSNKYDINNVGARKWYLFVDNFGGVGYIPLVSSSAAGPWTKVTSSYTLPGAGNGVTTRHGGILPITAAEMAQLQAGPTAKPATSDGKILQYNFAENGGTTIHDITGNGNDATAMGGAVLGGGALTLSGTNQYALLPNNLMAGESNVTIDADVYINPGQTGPYMIYGLGNTNVNTGNGDGYLFATGDPQYRTAITPTDWSQESSATSNVALPRGQWVRITMTEQVNLLTASTTLSEYLNGVEVESIDTPSVTSPLQLNGGWSPDDYIGRSLYNTDQYFSGAIKSFTIWNRTLTPDQVAALGAP